MPILMFDCETMIWKKKERSRIRAVQMNNLRNLLGIRRMDKGTVQSDKRLMSFSMVQPCGENGKG